MDPPRRPGDDRGGLGGPRTATIGMLLLGRAADEVDAPGPLGPRRHPAPAAERRRPVAAVHAGRARRPGRWEELVNTARPSGPRPPGARPGGQPGRALEHAALPHRAGGVDPGTRPRPLGLDLRLQLHGLGFAGARRPVGYLDPLGHRDPLSVPGAAGRPRQHPRLRRGRPDRARPGPRDGDEFAALLDEPEAHGLRVLVDVVPNHMAAHPANPWWSDVLARGRRPRPPPLSTSTGTAPGRPGAAGGAGGPAGRGHGGRRVGGGGVRRRRSWRWAGASGSTLPGPGATPAATGAAASLLSAQHYRLAYWRLGRWQGNYRRFFDVDGLVGVRVEDAEVFDRTHRLVLELAADPRVVGLRVDHVDGLADPEAYLRRLSERVAAGSRDRRARREDPGAGRGAAGRRWAADGTTGYEFAALCGGLFVDPAGAAAWRRPAPRRAVATLTSGSSRWPPGGRSWRCCSRARLRRWPLGRPRQPSRPGPAPTWRPRSWSPPSPSSPPGSRCTGTYLGAGPVPAVDRRRLATAAAAAGPALGPEGRRALGVFCDGVLAEDPGGGSDWAEVARRWQQLTGAVAAKAVEDTAFWRFDGLSGTAEVGADPAGPRGGPRRGSTGSWWFGRAGGPARSTPPPPTTPSAARTCGPA